MIRPRGRGRSDRCPYCRASFSPADKRWQCPGCETVHHQDCMKENHGCTVLGCTGERDEKAARRAAPTTRRAVVRTPVVQTTATIDWLDLKERAWGVFMVVLAVLCIAGLVAFFDPHRLWSTKRQPGIGWLQAAWLGFLSLMWLVTGVRLIRRGSDA